MVGRACALGIALAIVGTVDARPGASSHATDLLRARQRIPRQGYKGDSFASMAEVLTARLRASGHKVRHCAEWTVEELQHLQTRLFGESAEDLLAVYEHASDNRRQRFASLEDLQAHWADIDAAASEIEGLEEIRRDGLCHEAVMWAVHHIPVASQHKLRIEGVVLPSLPSRRHERPVSVASTEAHSKVHVEYESQVSCQQCHTGKIADPAWESATLPKPLPVDTVHPGQERQRACDYQNVPHCGPCEGLGGRRWGDDPEQMTPMKCEVIHGSEVKPTTRGVYPALATARLTGASRFPIEVVPTKPGHYQSLGGNLSLGWKDSVMRMRYDFGGFGSQVSAQSYEQAKNQDVGATFGAGGADCTCAASIAGVMHIESFEASDPFDLLKLPASQGGADYLGRIKVELDGDNPQTNGTVAIADHYLKWAFHFLVDADEASPSFGLPLRLYGATGVRQVFDSWRLVDPEIDRPDIWEMPADCNVTAPACSVFKKATTLVNKKAAADQSVVI